MQFFNKERLGEVVIRAQAQTLIAAARKSTPAHRSGLIVSVGVSILRQRADGQGLGLATRIPHCYRSGRQIDGNLDIALGARTRLQPPSQGGAAARFNRAWRRRTGRLRSSP